MESNTNFVSAASDVSRHAAEQNGSSPSAARGPEIEVVPIASVTAEAVEWVWQDRIPRGKLALLEGDPGTGKSWLTLAIAAAVSLGGKLPGGPDLDGPGRALLLTAEDGLADTVRPRLDQMTADLNRIEVLRGVRLADGSERDFDLVADLASLEKVLEAGRYDIVVVDPINAYLPAKLDGNSDIAIRSILRPLARLAESYHVAIIAVRHLRKSAADKAIYRGLGSIGYVGAARAVLLVGMDPEDNSGTRRIVVPSKCSLVPLAMAVGYEIRDGSFYWLGEREGLTADGLLAAPDAEEMSALDEAENFLRQVLTTELDPHELDRLRKQAGIAEKTLRRARASLGVRTRRDGFGKDSKVVVLALPRIDGQASIDGHDHFSDSEYKTPIDGQVSTNGHLGGSEPKAALPQGTLDDDASLLDNAAFASLAEHQPVGDPQVRNWRDELALDDNDVEASWAQEADAAEDPLVALVLKTYAESRVIGVRPAVG